MGKSRLLSLLIYLLLKLISLPPLVVSNCCSGPCQAISYCNGPCGDLNQYNDYSCNDSPSFINYSCDSSLICIEGKCNDDPNSGTHTCQETTPSLQSGGCEQSGNLTCEGCEPSNEEPPAPLCENGIPYPTYECSPTVTPSTPANLTKNDFSQGGDGGGAPSCGGGYEQNPGPIVALSTGWYNGGTRCNKMIRIQASNGQSVEAKVVDECSSMIGCDKEHAGQRPCENNIVDGSKAVWDALGLDPVINGKEVITWSMVD